MTSRAGSLIVAVFLGGVTLLAVFLILILTGDDDDAGGNALLQLSLDNGDVVLLGDPVELRVVARDDEPVTRIELKVDGVLISGDRPVEDPANGTFSATLSWVPDREGSVSVEVEVLSLSGLVTTRVVQVEVTQNAALVRSAPRLTIVSPPPLQRVPRGVPLAVLVQAQSDDPIVQFTLEVGDVVVDTVEAGADQSRGEPVTLHYTPTADGIVVLRVRATTSGDADGIAELTIEAVAAELVEQAAQADEEEVSGEAGILSIRNPADGDEIEFSEGLEIEVVIDTVKTGTLQSIELYVNAVLTQSVREEPRADGSYLLTLPFRPGTTGTYALEVVATSTRNQRFDSRVDITVVAPEGEEEEPPDEDPTEEEETAQRADLTPRAVTVGEGNTVVIEVANAGTEPMGPTPVLFSVTRTADGLLLAEQVVILALGAGESRLVPLDLGLTETIDVTVIVDTTNVIQESNENNNTITSVFEPLSRPDLVAQDLQLSSDGLPIVSLVNAGSDTASGPIVVLILFEGLVLERLSVAQDLATKGTLTLAGSVPVEGAGQLSAIVDPDNAIAEADEANNSITVSIAP